MFKPDLLWMKKDLPNLHGNYALGVLIRTLGYNRFDLVQAWSDWAGGNAVAVVPPLAGVLSSSAFLFDGVNAIYAFEGTRNIGQLAAQIITAQPLPYPGINGSVHPFFTASFYGSKTRLREEIAAVPTNTPTIFCGHSLGGAMASVAAHYFNVNGGLQPAGLLTFGEPRAGNNIFYNGFSCPYVRWINAGDIVPSLPPSVPVAIYTFPLQPLILAGQAFVHKQEAWRLYPSDEFDHGDNFLDTELFLPLLPGVVPAIHQISQAKEHGILSGYLKSLRPILARSTAPWDYRGLDAISDAMDAIDSGNDASWPVVSDLPFVGALVDPDATRPTDGSMPEVPSGDSGTVVEQRAVASRTYFFGGHPFMANTYRGHDRRMLQTAKKVLTNLVARDARTLIPKKTRALSNRIVVFTDELIDPAPIQISKAVNKLITILAAKIAQQD